MLTSIIAALVASASLAQAGNGWQATIDRVAPAVVVLKVSAPRAFDGDQAGHSTATGFVVDAERGLILTNRHVVMSGPVTAQAVFLNNEEVDVAPVYRDPVHDFGFYRFDPSDVKFMDVPELELAPDRAAVGREVRVIGNDAGEKLSILAGHDRAPRPRCTVLRIQVVQRFQHLLHPGGLGNLRRLFGLARHRHRRQGGGAERGRQADGGVELLPAPRSREARARRSAGGRGAAAGHAADGVRPSTLRRAAPARSAAADGGRGAARLPRRHRDDRRVPDRARRARRRGARAR